VTSKQGQRLLIDVGVVGLALVDSWVRAVHEDNGLAVSLLAALALTFRRRWPLVTFALTLPALYGADVLVAPVAALYTVAATCRSRAVVLSCGVVVALGRFIPWPPDLEDTAQELRHLTPLIFSTLYAAAPIALGILVSTRRELSQRLEQLTAGRQRLQQLVSETVIAQERARLAREMHDVVSHKVSLIAVQAGALRVTAPDPGVRDTADTIRQLSVQTLEELRQMVGVLRADGGHVPQLAPQPGLPDVHRLIMDSGLDATAALEEVGDRRWPESIERAVYRTVQEALTNVSKHAPGAPVTVRISPSDDGLQVAVRNGPSATPPPTSDLPGGRHGLLGLRERAELLGGVVSAEPTEDGGFLVEATFPHTSGRERLGQA
jgi:signal transduction histidine kinase